MHFGTWELSIFSLRYLTYGMVLLCAASVNEAVQVCVGDFRVMVQLHLDNDTHLCTPS